MLQIQTTSIKSSRTETVIGIIILCILACIGAGVYRTQFHFNPAVLAIQEQSQSRTPAIPFPPKIIPFFSVSPEFSPLTPPEQFNAETLSDKINGKAELYLSAGFDELQCQRFFLTNQPDVWVEVYIYRMTDHTKAFSVFSSQRRQDARETDIAPYSYQTGNAVFLTHGNYYAELISSLAGETGVLAAVSLAKQWIDQTQIDSKAADQISEMELFPKANLIENSIRLLSANVFGYDRFQDIFTASYQMGTNSVTAFISQKDTSEAAQELADGYYRFLLSFGGRDVEPPKSIPHSRMVLILDVYICIFHQGRFIAGVHEAPSADIAGQLSKEIFHRLSEVSHGSYSN